MIERDFEKNSYFLRALSRSRIGQKNLSSLDQSHECQMRACLWFKCGTLDDLDEEPSFLLYNLRVRIIFSTFFIL